MKSKKTLAILLAVMMILSSVPMFASAAISLTSSNIKVIPPSVSPLEVNYGATYADLTISGGTCYYIDDSGNEIEVAGHFEVRSTRQVPNVSDAHLVTLMFIPDDTTTYNTRSGTLYGDKTTIVSGTWPTIKVIGAERTLAEAPTITLESGKTNIREAVISGGVVKDADGNEITTGTWTFADYTAVPVNGGSYELVWTCKGYASITTSATLTIEGGEEDTTVYGAVTTWPEIECPEWTKGMTVADLTLKGGEATVEGTFAITTAATTKIEPNTDNNITVKFTPADSEIVMTTDTVKTLTIAPTYVPKKITIPENIVITKPYSNAMKGSWVTANAADLGIEPTDAKISFYNTENVDSGFYKQNLYPGEYDAYITVSADYYESATVPVKVIITPGKSDGQPVRGGAVSKAQNDGSYIITASVSAYYGAPQNNGTMLIYVNGETIAEFPVSTETQKVDYLVTESGDYNVSVGYKAGEGDYYIYTKDEWPASETLSFNVTMPRDIKTDNCEVETGTRTENGKYVVGTTVYMTGKSFDTAKYRYSAWKFYDDDGNEFSPADLTISDNGKRITFTMPNHDMKAQFIIEKIPEEERPDTGDDSSSLLPDLDDIELPDIGDLELDTEGDHKFKFVNIIQNLIEMLKNFIKQIGQTIEGIL